MSKKSLGQFNTTNKNYILSGLESYVENKSWIDPYGGNGDLIDWAKSYNALSISGYDIDTSKVNNVIEQRDTLLNPPDYSNKYIIANPPYMARNKCKDKTLYDKYNQDDLYKIAILTTIGCLGGIFIVPLNFLSSVYANDIRDIFFEHYQIKCCKIFEETVFEDTDYTVCAFYFEKRTDHDNEIKVIFCPSKKEMTFKVSKEFHWILGEEFYRYINNVKHTGIGRWTEKDKGEIKATVYVNDFNNPQERYINPDIYKDIILIRAIDTGTKEGKIGLSDIRKEVKLLQHQPVMLGLETSRNKAHVKFKQKFSIEDQLKIIENVNEKLENFREKYNSVFLTAFRNSTKSYSRKRISFDAIYKMVAIEIKNL